jgi:hypothetical protein
MLTENWLEIDFDALNEVLERADVLTIAFALFPERLLVDARSQGEEGPLVEVVAPVATVQERYLWLGKHRPNFGAPEAFSFFLWPRTLRLLKDRDALAPLRARLERAPGNGGRALDKIIEGLVERERQAIKGAVRGEQPWHTLWQRQ